MTVKIKRFDLASIFGANCVREADRLYDLIHTAPPAGQYIFNMSRVTFIRPYGAMVLVMAARILSEISQCPVVFENLSDQTHSYLDRMNLFRVGSDWLESSDNLHEEWNRNPETTNLLELTTITGPADVATVLASAQRIFSPWIVASDLNNLLSVLSELCTNIYTHSTDSYGSVLIQKYEASTHNQVIVCLTVGDLGCGIRQSLTNKYGEIGLTPLDYLREAMRGLTSRNSGRGGVGLRLVEQIAKSVGGYIWLRSDTAGIFSKGEGQAQGFKNLMNIRGTQVAVELHASIIQ